MPHARIQQGTVTDSTDLGAGSSFSFNHTVDNQPTKVLLVFIGTRDASTAGDTAVTSCSFGAQSMTAVANDINGGGGAVAVRMSVFILNNPTAGTGLVAYSTNAAVNQSRAYALTLWNIDQTTQQDATATTTNGSTANPALSITTVTDRAYVVGSFFGNNNDLSAPASGQSELAEATDGSTYDIELSGQEVVSPGATAMNLTRVAAKWAYVLVALRPRRRKIHVEG